MVWRPRTKKQTDALKRRLRAMKRVREMASMARERGCHAGMQYLAAALSYAEPVPVEPKDEADELRRQFIESTRTLAKMAQRIEQLERPSPRAVA